MDEKITEQIRQQLQNGAPGEQAVRRLADTALNDAQKASLQAMLQSPEALQKLLQSERAQSLLKKLQNPPQR